MTATTLTLAVLSTLSVIPTTATLVVAVRDRGRRKRVGINGELAALASESMSRELVRLVKHTVLIIGIWCLAMGRPQAWDRAVVCWLLSGTSMYALVFRRWLERRLQQKQGTR